MTILQKLHAHLRKIQEEYTGTTGGVIKVRDVSSGFIKNPDTPPEHCIFIIGRMEFEYTKKLNMLVFLRFVRKEEV